MLPSRQLLRALAVSVSALALSPGGAVAQSPSCADADLAASPETAAAVTAAVHCLVDAERAAHGLPALAAESRLGTAAAAFAAQMVQHGFFAHEGPDGSTPGSRVTAEGYRWSSVGENIAAGRGTAREAMTAWMTSPQHCANVLAARYTQLGVGFAGTGRDVRWVQDFARPTGVAAPASSRAATACPAGGPSSSAASGGSGEAGGSSPTTGSLSGGSGTGQGVGDGAGPGAGARVVFRVTKLRGGKLRIAGQLTGAGRRTVRVEVRRGARRSVRFVRTSGRFAVRMTGRRGARVTVSAAGATRRLTVR